MDNNGHVTLPWITLTKAVFVGATRQLRAIRDNLPDRFACDADDGWRLHIEGACGEAAAALCLGLPWQPDIDAFHIIPDLAGMEIRTRSRHSYELIIRKDDASQRIYILVTGRAPHFWVRGWIRGADARREDWWDNPGDRENGWAWFVPNDALHPISELITMIREAQS